MLICHSSYRGVVELFRDLFDTPISVGTVHNRLQETADKAIEIHQAQDLSRINFGLHDEIFHLLESVERLDEDTWGYCLLNLMEQGFDPDYTIADRGSGLRAGQKAAMPEISCHGDIFHIQRQSELATNGLIRRVQGGLTRRIKQAQQMANTFL